MSTHRDCHHVMRLRISGLATVTPSGPTNWSWIIQWICPLKSYMGMFSCALHGREHSRDVLRCFLFCYPLSSCVSYVRLLGVGLSFAQSTRKWICGKYAWTLAIWLSFFCATIIFEMWRLSFWLPFWLFLLLLLNHRFSRHSRVATVEISWWNQLLRLSVELNCWHYLSKQLLILSVEISW